MGTPRPLISVTSRPFWDALRDDRIVLQRCERCSAWIFYPRVLCPRCGGTDLAWRPVDGAATLYTFTVAEVPVAPDFIDETPLALAIVELEIGVKIPTTLVNVAPDDIHMGMALLPFFDHDRFPDITLLRFRPADGAAQGGRAGL